jgi:hypothetical protein
MEIETEADDMSDFEEIIYRSTAYDCHGENERNYLKCLNDSKAKQQSTFPGTYNYAQTVI